MEACDGTGSSSVLSGGASRSTFQLLVDVCKSKLIPQFKHDVSAISADPPYRQIPVPVVGFQDGPSTFNSSKARDELTLENQFKVVHAAMRKVIMIGGRAGGLIDGSSVY